MTLPESNQRYGYKDMLQWDGRWELINGVPHNMTPAPSTEHQRIVGGLFFELRLFLQGRSCEVFVAPFDLRFSHSEDYDNPDTVCQPDITVICDPKQIDEKGGKGAPKLIVEILSPSTAIKDRNEKFKAYEKFGVSEYWIVDPTHQTVEVYGWVEGEYRKREVYGRESLLLSFVFPELRLDLGKIFS